MSHHTVHFKLSKHQMIKLAHAHKHNTDVSLQLSKHNVHHSGVPLELTSAEYSLIMSNSGKHNIHISASRVKRGGFLPAILAALPTIATVLSGLAGASTVASNIKNMIQGSGCYNHPSTVQHKIQMAQHHMYKAQGFISDLNIPIISPLAKFIGLGNKRKGKKSVASGLYLNKGR